MAVTISVQIGIADTDTASTLFFCQKTSAAIAPEDSDLSACIAIAMAKMGTTVAEVEADIREQTAEAERGTNL